VKTKCGRRVPPPPPIRSEDVHRYRDRLAEYLAQNGLRFTEPRWKVAQAVLSSARHLDSATLVERVAKKYPDVGSATVYRAIRLLCDAGILEESHQSASGTTVYELSDDEHHDHILCSDCGATFEFHDAALEAAQERIAREQGFSLSGHRHVLIGRCSLLQSSGPKEAQK
jgi:Fur family transcriptional regulator, ferric uptake regulator